MQPDMLDESQRAVDAARAHLLLSRRVMSQGETASTASRIVESGMRSGLQPTISTVFQAFVLWFPDDIAFFQSKGKPLLCGVLTTSSWQAALNLTCASSFLDLWCKVSSLS